MLCFSFKGMQTKTIVLAVFCGLAFMSIPITRIVITAVTGFPYGSMATGLLYPLALHFVFGFTGGLIASGTFTLFRNKKK
jgi:hypothetical protein